MATWIFPSNPENFDVNEEFYKQGKINWFQNQSITNILPGDIVYIYFSAHVHEIHWKCKVEKVKFFLRKDDEDSFSYVQNEEFYNGPFIDLRPLINFDIKDELSFKKLQENGLKSKLMGNQRIDGELLKYINKIEKIQCNKDLYEKYLSDLSEDKIEQNAKKDSKQKVRTKTVETVTYQRSPYIAQYAKNKAKGICQLCGKQAPFDDKNGQPYLESHHIIWLSKGGADSIDNVVALCPNCHRKMHIVSRQEDIDYLLSKINGK